MIFITSIISSPPPSKLISNSDRVDTLLRNWKLLYEKKKCCSLACSKRFSAAMLRVFGHNRSRGKNESDERRRFCERVKTWIIKALRETAIESIDRLMLQDSLFFTVSRTNLNIYDEEWTLDKSRTWLINFSARLYPVCVCLGRCARRTIKTWTQKKRDNKEKKTLKCNNTRKNETAFWWTSNQSKRRVKIVFELLHTHSGSIFKFYLKTSPSSRRRARGESSSSSTKKTSFYSPKKVSLYCFRAHFFSVQLQEAGKRSKEPNGFICLIDPESLCI